MTRRWGLQAAMTATYVAVTAGAVLLTELVIFLMAAIVPQVPLTAAQVQGLAQVTAAGLAAKLGVSVTAAGALPSTYLGLAGTPLSPGQARPDGSGGVTIPWTATPRATWPPRRSPSSCPATAPCSRPPTRRATRWAATARTCRRARRARC